MKEIINYTLKEAYVPKAEHITFHEEDVLEITDVTVEMLKMIQ